MASFQLFYVGFSQKNGARVVHIDGKRVVYCAHPRGMLGGNCPLKLFSVYECKDVAKIVREITLEKWQIFSFSMLNLAKRMGWD